MATISTYTKSGSDKLYVLLVSDAALPADTIQLEDLPTSGPTHVFLGVQMFDSGGLNVVASAGTFTVSVMTLNTKQWEAPFSATITGSAPLTIDFAANVVAIRVVPTGITGVTTYKAFVSFNKS